jgi:hypothetical protein
MEEQQKALSVLNRVRLVSTHLEVLGLQRVDQDKVWVLLAAALLGPDAERIDKRTGPRGRICAENRAAHESLGTMVGSWSLHGRLGDRRTL